MIATDQILPRSSHRRSGGWMLFVSSVVVLCGLCELSPAQTAGDTTHAGAAPADGLVTLPQDQWVASGIEIERARQQPLEKMLRLTGKITLNEDRVAHIYSMVEGTVDDVSVRLGQKVKSDDLLAVIHSREVGTAKLTLYQARLQLELARTKNEVQTMIAANARELLQALRANVDIGEIENQFRDRPMGDFRERALASYAAFIKSEIDVARLEKISQSGAVSGKTLTSARAKRNADQATFQARIEQIQHELRTSTLISEQAVKEAEAQALVAATNLRILNVERDEIAQIDPAEQGETLSHYAIRAPFDGTVLTKDVVLREQVRPDVLLFSIADLSTVWVTANVYEEHLPFLDAFRDQEITLRNDALPEQVFTAKVFYTGEIMDETTRTISLRAIADNSHRRLKPGMFVNLELPVRQSESVVVPSAAVQQHQGQDFVFVLRGDDHFQRRDVSVGPSSGNSIVIRSGLQAGEPVVTAGGFILKSQLLADLLGDE